ncbi:hypothetical protein N7523_006919 [Penicillium sp. IBT 18751x]|nr:hypothetical protein N7523_006919 [Penicillium sp. IBT 18751x]
MTIAAIFSPIDLVLDPELDLTLYGEMQYQIPSRCLVVPPNIYKTVDNPLRWAIATNHTGHRNHHKFLPVSSVRAPVCQGAENIRTGSVGRVRRRSSMVFESSIKTQT